MAKSAVLEREKRSTAGTRMSTLVGQAVEDDDTFWNHSTWNDGEGGGGEESDGSFRESDEDEENRKDTFDSDFNDSESDEDDDKEAGKVCGEEKDLRLEEKREQGMKRKGVYKDPSIGKKSVTTMSAGRELMQKKKSPTARKKALKGEGMNAGLVLNFPGAAPLARSFAKKPGAPVVPGLVPKLPSSRQGNRFKSRKSPGTTKTIGIKRSLRASTITTSIQANAARRAAAAVSSSTSSKVRIQKDFTQEELILEALQVTESENERWILSRKRILDEEQRAELKKKLLGQNASKGKVIRKMYSRRGCYNTITFPDMDYVPEIFTRNQETKATASKTVQRKKANVCVITGKVARYRDPKTMKAYYDLAAFKILRKRFEAGELLEGPVESLSTLADRPRNTTFAERVPLPDLLDILGCNNAVTIDNSLTTELKSDSTPIDCLLENDTNTSPSAACQITKPRENGSLKNDHLLNGTTTSSRKIFSEVHDMTMDCLIKNNVTTSSLQSWSEAKLGKPVTPKLDPITNMTIDSPSKMDTSIGVNDAKLSTTVKLVVGPQKIDSNLSTHAAELSTDGPNQDLLGFPTNRSQSLKAGQEHCGGEASDPKVKTKTTDVPATFSSISENMKLKNSGTTVAGSKVKDTLATIHTASIIIPGGVEEENCEQRIFNAKAKDKMATIPVASVGLPVDVEEKKLEPKTFDGSMSWGAEEKNCEPTIFNTKAKMVATAVAPSNVPGGVEGKHCGPRLFDAKATVVTTPVASISMPGGMEEKNCGSRKAKAKMTTIPVASVSIPRGVKEKIYGPRIFNTKAKAKMATTPAVLVSMPGHVKEENSWQRAPHSKVKDTLSALHTASISTARDLHDCTRLTPIEAYAANYAMETKAKMTTTPAVLASMPRHMKEENSWQGASDSKVEDTLSALRAASISTARDFHDCTRLTPIEAYAATYAMEKNSIARDFNATNFPSYKRAIPATSSAGRKKRKSKKVINDVENPSTVAPSAYFGGLHAPLASHLSPMAPSFCHPLSNLSNPHLHHLIAKSNQIPYVYSNPIQPPPLDIATLYALGLTSPLQTVPTTSPLSLQNQQLLHQRGNALPTMSYHQPSHMPVVSGDILGDLIRSYNIVSAADIEHLAQQQQQEYQASKNNENGHR